jgi:hypothetical protein
MLWFGPGHAKCRESPPAANASGTDFLFSFRCRFQVRPCRIQ